jgi:hypothetical protein
MIKISYGVKPKIEVFRYEISYKINEVNHPGYFNMKQG